MDDDTSDATLLLDLDGIAVERVERLADGSRVAWVVTADAAAACPACGVFSRRSKGVVNTGPRDLPCGSGGLRLVWVKRRWYCREPVCERGSFTESCPAVPARARVTTRLRAEAGDRVVDGTCATVVASARQVGLSWPTVMDAVRVQAGGLSGGPVAPVEVLGIDEVRRGRPRWRPAGEPSDAAPPAPSPAPGPVSRDPAAPPPPPPPLAAVRA